MSKLLIIGLACTLALVLTGAGQAADYPIDATCSPNELALGSDTTLVWTITAIRDREGAASVVTQHLLDGAQVVFPGRSPWVIGGFRIDKRGDMELPLPVIVVLPGAASFLREVGPAIPGRTNCRLELAGNEQSGVNVVEVLPAAVGAAARQTLTYQQVASRSRSQFWCVLIDAPGSATSRADITATIVGPYGESVQSAVDPVRLWSEAIVEWTRLPSQAGQPTMVWSPILAGLSLPLPYSPLSQRPAGKATAAEFPVRHFALPQTLLDPVDGTVHPGQYWVRIASSYSRESGKREIVRSDAVQITITAEEAAAHQK